MNQTDYKAIAEIIRICKEGQKQYGIFAACAVEAVALELADYFEKEDAYTIRGDRDNKGNYIEYPICRIFNRQQFLKDCGVSE